MRCSARRFLVGLALVAPSVVVHSWVPRSLLNKKTGSTALQMKTSTKTASSPLPKLPLPDPICSTEPGTWAYDTMSRRVDEEILERTWQDNKETWEKPEWKVVKERFEALREELRSAATTQLTYLDELPEGASEMRQREWSEWKLALEPFVEKQDTWLSAPWMVTEFYVYRRLIQCLDYFNPDSVGYLYDPFVPQKRAGLESSVTSADAMLKRIPELPPNAAGLEIAASIALWGNKMDLSLWPANVSQANQDIFSEILNAAQENLLHDDSAALAEHCEKLRESQNGDVDIIVDNAGFELVTDLALAQYLIESGIAQTVTFQLKSHPTFVSDALEKDLVETVEYYASLDQEQYPHAHAAGQRWKEFLASGKWQCQENSFWVQGFAMWEMHEDLREDLATRCDLAFVKGDANYRRLLGDRPWDTSAPFGDVVGAYFPCPVCALRTLKAELGCGMAKEQTERAQALDDAWMTNGRFGVVHFSQ